MRTIIIISMCLLLSGSAGSAYSQESKPTRQEKKEARKLALEANYIILDSILTNKGFVIEADYLSNRYGDKAPVSSNINFIRVTGDKGVLQTGSTFARGSNGVGGTTAEGNIGSYEITKFPKSKSYKVRFNIQTGIGHYDVILNVSANARADATITGLGRGDLTWEGHLVTLGNSRTFKGWNTIW